ncbi:hypothetical protein P280DRAFT_80128 [Massarina eburnea CBS 473.64]|uniref:Uncharacterized protein n=1 Tax=Massarina eburnea CBS 473.64 TaxID=1395130 RepID=A0A6A6RRL1_9PLEO|nr:hypothetical protein P280DRAFT_80128 [Massarina eburnea CBS 473.64]
MASYAPGSNRPARLHKRGYSASAMTSQLSPVADQGAFIFRRSETPKITYEEEIWTDYRRPMPITSLSHTKIKPYLRYKLSTRDPNSLDLSRPAEENERLAGLGISEYGDYSRSINQINFAPVNGRNRHARASSNTSQFSTSSGLQRQTAPYMPPIRQTPQPYTPPIPISTPASVMGSETEADDIMNEDEYRFRQAFDQPARRSGSISSNTPGRTSTLRIHTTGSSTLLAASYSQSSSSLTSPMATSHPLPSPMAPSHISTSHISTSHTRSRGDTLRSLETVGSPTSPSTRTSFDKAFGFVRGGRESPVDPEIAAMERAANIRAAREAFAAKEAATAEKEVRKQHRRIESQRRKSDTHTIHAHKRSRSISDSNNEKTSRLSIGGRQYSDHREPHTRTLPNHTEPVIISEKPSGFLPKTKSREAKSNWARFMAWLKTRMLRIKRRLHR